MYLAVWELGQLFRSHYINDHDNMTKLTSLFRERNRGSYRIENQSV